MMTDMNTPPTVDKLISREKGVRQKLALVLVDMPDISKTAIQFKTKTGAIVQYDAYTSDPILKAIRPILGEHGLSLNCDEKQIYKTATGDIMIQFLFTLADGETGDFMETIVNQPIPSMSTPAASYNAADTFAIKRYLRRIGLISDPNEEDPENAIARSNIPDEEIQAYHGKVIPVVRITTNKSAKSDKSPKSHAYTNADVPLALWSNSLSQINSLLGLSERTLHTILDKRSIEFKEPLMLKVRATQYGLNMDKSGHPDSLNNPAILQSLIHKAGNIIGISDLTNIEMAKFLNVESLSDDQGTIWDAIRQLEHISQIQKNSHDISPEPELD